MSGTCAGSARTRLPARLADALSSLGLVPLAVTTERGTAGSRETGGDAGGCWAGEGRDEPTSAYFYNPFLGSPPTNLGILVISRTAWIQILPLPLSCVIFGKLQNFSVPPHL